jgi:hypothetical protein
VSARWPSGCGAAAGRADWAARSVLVSNYRGAHVSSVPEAAIPEVLVTLARARARQAARQRAWHGTRMPAAPASARPTRPARRRARPGETRGQRTTSGSPAAHRSPASPASCKLITERDGAFPEQGHENRRSGRPDALSYRFKCRSGSGRLHGLMRRRRCPGWGTSQAIFTGRGMWAVLCGHGLAPARFPLRVRLTKQRRRLGCRDTLRVDVDTVTGGRDRGGPRRPLRLGPGAHGSV